MFIDFKGKRALVTGGTRGIGQAIAQGLMDADARVTVTGTKPEPPPLPPGIDYLACDFSDDRQLEQLTSRLRESEAFDILINNAGINKIAPLDEIDDADYERLWRVNLKAPFALTKALSPAMKQRNWGRIVNISSIFGNVTKAQRASYTSSKFGLLGLTKTSAVELAPHNVLVNCVAPGFVNTELTQSILSGEQQRELADQVPMRRFAEPEEIANLVIFLCSPRNTYITGENILIDGGFVSV